MGSADQLLTEYALRAISDDYESFDWVVKEVTTWSKERGIPVSQGAILLALETLINEGLAQAFFLSAGPPGKIEMAPYSRDNLDRLWFYVTPKGCQLAQEFKERWR